MNIVVDQTSEYHILKNSDPLRYIFVCAITLPRKIVRKSICL